MNFENGMTPKKVADESAPAAPEQSEFRDELARVQEVFPAAALLGQVSELDDESLAVLDYVLNQEGESLAGFGVFDGDDAAVAELLLQLESAESLDDKKSIARKIVNLIA